MRSNAARRALAGVVEYSPCAISAAAATSCNPGAELQLVEAVARGGMALDFSVGDPVTDADDHGAAVRSKQEWLHYK